MYSRLMGQGTIIAGSSISIVIGSFLAPRSLTGPYEDMINTLLVSKREYSKYLVGFQRSHPEQRMLLGHMTCCNKDDQHIWVENDRTIRGYKNPTSPVYPKG